MGIESIKSQMKCRCCGGELLDTRMLGFLVMLERSLGRLLTINSGYRCVSHNKSVNGSTHSFHLLGQAADIAVMDADDAERIEALALKIGFGGIGHGRGFIHCDVGPTRPAWRYGPDGKPIHAPVTA